MQRGTFEKYTCLSALILISLLTVSSEVCVPSFSTRISNWIDTGIIFKLAAIATAFTFFAIKLISSGEKTL